MLFPALIGACLSAMSCHKDDPTPEPQPADETGSDVTEVGDETDGPVDSVIPDVGPDAPPTVSCTKAPIYRDPLKINHNLDSRRNVARASMTLLPDGKILVVFLEAIDSTSVRYGVYARTVDPGDGTKPPTVGADERLDLDGDALVASSALSLSAVGNGASVVTFGTGSERRLRIFERNKWSPEMGASGMAITSSDSISWAGASSGTVLITRTRGSAPSAQGIVYRPDEGGALGSWSPAQTLDLDSGSGTALVVPFALADGRYLTMVWHGSGGPSVRLRNISGAWTTAGARAEIGPLPATGAIRLLDDGSIVFAALEAATTGTASAVTSTWTIASGWTTGRVLSKTKDDSNGVIPDGTPHYLFGSGNSAEFVAWVASCAGPATGCTFQAMSRKYEAGAWKTATELAVGDPTTGAAGLSVVALGPDSPLVARRAKDGSKVEIRARLPGADYAPTTNIFFDSPLFGSGVEATAGFWAGKGLVWSLAGRVPTPDGGPPMATSSAVARIIPTPTATASAWSTVNESTSGTELRTASPKIAYVDGSGGLTIGADNATISGTDTVPLLVHVNIKPTGEIVKEARKVQAADEKSASFVLAPPRAARSGLDKGALVVVSSVPSDPAAKGNKLTAYAWSGFDTTETVTTQILANETRVPRAMDLMVIGCGGAVLYAVDPDPIAHGLELVLVQ